MFWAETIMSTSGPIKMVRGFRLFKQSSRRLEKLGAHYIKNIKRLHVKYKLINFMFLNISIKIIMPFTTKSLDVG